MKVLSVVVDLRFKFSTLVPGRRDISLKWSDVKFSCTCTAVDLIESTKFSGVDLQQYVYYLQVL